MDSTANHRLVHQKSAYSLAVTLFIHISDKWTKIVGMVLQ